MTISQRIFYELKKQGKKQKELADYIGLSTSAISDWKKKGTNPAAENISAIADFLKISTDYLLTGREKENYSQKYNVSQNQNYGTIHSAFGDEAHQEINLEIRKGTSSDDSISDDAIEYQKILNSLSDDDRKKFISMVNAIAGTYKKK